MRMHAIKALGILALLAAGAAEAVTQTERWDLETGHSVVFFEDDKGGFGVYEVGEYAKHPSILQSELSPTPQDAAALYAALQNRQMDAADSEKYPTTTDPDEPNANLVFSDAVNWSLVNCGPMESLDKHGCSTQNRVASSPGFYSTHWKAIAKAPDSRGSVVRVWNEEFGQNEHVLLHGLSLAQGQYVAFEYINIHGAYYSVSNVAGSLGPLLPERAFLAYGYDEAFPQCVTQSEYPSDISHWWTEDHQGVAHDGGYWYFTNSTDNDSGGEDMRLSNKLVKADRGTNLGGTQPLQASVAIPQALWNLGYWHMGDPDVYNGMVLVPVSDGDGNGLGNGNLPAIVIAYRASDLAFLGHSALRGGGGPWAAVNPKDGKLYTSKDLNDLVSNATLERYTIQTSPAFGLTFDAEVPLENKHYRMQGGAFSSSGRFFLVQDSRRPVDGEGFGWIDYGNAGIYGYSIPSGKQRFFHPISYDAAEWVAEELEGITIVDADPSDATFDGQIHVTMNDNDSPSGDDLYFKHFDICYDWDKKML